MHFVVDESGQFTPSSGVGCMCLLAIPSRYVRKVKRELLQATASWEKHNGELKSGSITLQQLTASRGRLQTGRASDDPEIGVPPGVLLACYHCVRLSGVFAGKMLGIFDLSH